MWLIFFFFFLFSGTLMLSSIMFYYLSRFLIVLIHFIVNGEPLLIFSLFLILTYRKSRDHLSALSESLSQFKWNFKTFVYSYTVHYIHLFFWIFIICRFYSRKNTLETNHFQIYYQNIIIINFTNYEIAWFTP